MIPKKLVVVALLLMQTLMLSSQSQIDLRIREEILTEFQILHSLYGEKLFLSKVGFLEPEALQINNIDTLAVAKNQGISGYLVKVNIQNPHSFFTADNGILDNGTFEFFLIIYSGKVYRLFGFYTSDIRSLIESFEPSSLTMLQNLLKESQLLSRRMIRKYLRTIEGTKATAPKSLKMNSAILEIIFASYKDVPNSRAQTIILQKLTPLRI